MAAAIQGLMTPIPYAFLIFLTFVLFLVVFVVSVFFVFLSSYPLVSLSPLNLLISFLFISLSPRSPYLLLSPRSPLISLSPLYLLISLFISPYPLLSFYNHAP